MIALNSISALLLALGAQVSAFSTLDHLLHLSGEKIELSQLETAKEVTHRRATFDASQQLVDGIFP
jgi:hypothetical protein